VIIISHKRSTLSDTDKLLVLDGGRVKTFGPREEVLQQLWKPQVVVNTPGGAPAPGTASAPAAQGTAPAAPERALSGVAAKK
jgi:ABC-type multidrug transport system ATPase subunit